MMEARVTRKEEEGIQQQAETAMVKIICGIKLRDRKSSMMSVVGLSEAILICDIGKRRDCSGKDTCCSKTARNVDIKFLLYVELVIRYVIQGAAGSISTLE